MKCHLGNGSLALWWVFTMSVLVFSRVSLINSLAPGKFELNFRHVIFKQILVIDGWGISCEIALIWMSLDFTDDQWTLFQVMAWCHQATSHYLSQCWPISLLPYGVTRPQWVKKDESNVQAFHSNLYVSTYLTVNFPLNLTSSGYHWMLTKISQLWINEWLGAFVNKPLPEPVLTKL